MRGCKAMLTALTATATIPIASPGGIEANQRHGEIMTYSAT